MASSQTSNSAPQNPPSLAAIRDRQDYLLRNRPRFRVLIIGKANAGKTTILKKICQSTEEPIVHDRNGRRISAEKMGAAGRERGIHDINNEITYKSNPGFVFHDSGGFEAGDNKEVKDVEDFIRHRATTKDLKGQLHAIWYCLPADAERAGHLLEVDRKFLEKQTQVNNRVPVVVIVTKFDKQIDLHLAELPEEDSVSEEVISKARDQARGTFRQLEDAIKAMGYGCIYMEDVDKEEADCSQLTETTVKMLNNDILVHLLVTVQRNNMEQRIKFAIREILDSRQNWGLKNIALISVKWFRHIWLSSEFERSQSYSQEFFSQESYYSSFFRSSYSQKIVKILLSYKELSSNFKFIPTFLLKQPNFYALASFLIILEHSFWQPQNDFKDTMHAAAQAFIQSSLPEALQKAIYAAHIQKIQEQEQCIQCLTDLVTMHLLPHPM